MAQRNARDPEAVRVATRRAQKRAQRELADYRWIMSDERGRRVLWQLLGDTGIFRTSFTGNSETFFKEGERNVGLKVFTKIHQADPEKYLAMAREAANLEAQEALEDNAMTGEESDG